MALGLAAAPAGLLVRHVRALPAAEEEYSAYKVPEKPAVSSILSEPATVEEFRNDFGLGEREVEAVLAAPSAENAVLSDTYAGSEVIAESRIRPRQGRVRPRGSEPRWRRSHPISRAAKLGLRKYESPGSASACPG